EYLCKIYTYNSKGQSFLHIYILMTLTIYYTKSRSALQERLAETQNRNDILTSYSCIHICAITSNAFETGTVKSFLKSRIPLQILVFLDFSKYGNVCNLTKHESISE